VLIRNELANCEMAHLQAVADEKDAQ
jgi:hypothetical protein